MNDPVRLALVPLALAVTLGGCVAGPPLRVSTDELMQPAETKLALDLPKAKVASAVKDLMGERGFHVKTRVATPDERAEYLVFSGPRKLLSGSNTIATVGSWFAVRLEQKDAVTHVRFLGKPNLGGQELCSDADQRLAEVQYWCKDTHVNPMSPYYSQLSGREERETIMGLVRDLKDLAPASGGLGVRAKKAR